MGDSIPLQGYSEQVRRWLLPHYEAGGVTRFEVGSVTFECVNPDGNVTQRQPMAKYRWTMPSRMKFVRCDGEELYMRVRPWRMLAAQEPQITYYEGDWNQVLAHLDSYDLFRNPSWPFRRGAIWLPRGSGGGWKMFLEAVRHVRVGEPWPYLVEQMRPYESVLMKYGDRLDFLIEKETTYATVSGSAD